LVFDQDPVRPEINNRIGKLQRAAFDDVHVVIVISAGVDGALDVDQKVGASTLRQYSVLAFVGGSGYAGGSGQRMRRRCAENHHQQSGGHLLQPRAN